MKIKQILCLVVAIAMVSPLMAGDKVKKAPGLKGQFVSITEEQVIVKIKGEEKTYTINKETKIFNKAGEEVAVADVKFQIVELKTNPEDANAVVEIKEAAAPVKKDKAAKGKKKKEE